MYFLSFCWFFFFSILWFFAKCFKKQSENWVAKPSETKEESVNALKGDLCDGVWRWKLYRRRNLRVLELRQLDQLKHMLSGVQFILNKKDTRVWEADSQARFPVNTLSKLIDRVVLPKFCTVLLSIMAKNWVLQR